jgi:hypothetical protein
MAAASLRHDIVATEFLAATQLDVMEPRGEVPTPPWIAGLMGFEAATFAVMSALHLSGVLADGSDPYDPTAAGIAEAVICLALASGAVALLRQSANANGVATATTGLAIVGVVIGLIFTIQGGGPIDIAYHATVLPLLVLTLAALRRVQRATQGA